MRWRLAFVATVTLACVVAVAFSVDLRGSIAALRSYRTIWLIPLTGLLILTFLGRVWRFRALLDAPVPVSALTSVMAVSLLAIPVLPLRMGELIRPWLLVDRYEVPVGAALAAVLLERALDLVALGAMLAATALVVDTSQTLHFGGVDLVTAGQRAIGAAALGGVAVVGIVAVLGDRAVQGAAGIAGRISEPLAQRVRGVGGPFVAGVGRLSSEPGRLAQAVVSTLVVWGLTLLTVAVAMAGMPGLQPAVDVVLANWSATMVGVVLIPTPGYLGAFEVASVGSLTVLGVPEGAAAGFALGLHALILGFAVATGVCALAWEGWSLPELVRGSRSLGGR